MSTPDRGADESGPHLRYVPADPVLHAVDVTLQRAARVRSTGLWVFGPAGLGFGLALSWLIAGGALPLAWLQDAAACLGAALLALPFHLRARCRQDAALAKVVEALRGMGER